MDGCPGGGVHATPKTTTTTTTTAADKATGTKVDVASDEVNEADWEEAHHHHDHPNRRNVQIGMWILIAFVALVFLGTAAFLGFFTRRS